MAPTLDVIIPCRNAPETLWTTLAYFWAYAYSPEQIGSVLLIDNCSGDPRMRPLLAHVQAHRPNHYVIQSDENVGVWCSVNRGLAATRAPFVFVLTSDVLLGRDTFTVLLDMMRVYRDVSMLGPEVFTGFENVPSLVTHADTRIKLDRSTYNGAAWLLRWERLRTTVGWYDPRFYVCAGDTDYTERMKRANEQFGVARGLPCVHLDKATRRADGNAIADTEVEIKDMRAFHEKWADAPEVLARHALPNREMYVAIKERAGWGKDTWKGI